MTATDAHRDATPAEPTFEELAEQVDAAIAAIGELDGEAAERAAEVRRAIEAFHRPALVHIVRTLRADPRGKELLFQLVDDPAVRAVLALHGIIRADPMTRARQALVAVRPYLQSHGGDVDIVRIEDGAAHVRLQGSCRGCSMSAVTLREGVEEALVGAVEEIDRIVVLDEEPTTTFIPLADVGRSPGGDGWVAGPATTDVAPGTMLRFDVDTGTTQTGSPSSTGGEERASFVVTNIDQRIAVFRNECAHQGRSLDGGLLDEGVLTCPWHGFRFDATTGECLSAPGAQLTQVPSRVDGGRIWVRTDGR